MPHPWPRERIHELLLRSDRAVERALLVLLDNQTEQERGTERALEHNGIGFNKREAKILTSMAKQVSNGRPLTQRQLAFLRRPSTRYGFLIGKYWRQLQRAIPQHKAAA